MIMVRRLVQLVFGLSLYGVAAALMVRADLGLSPWHVFHQGVARVTGISFGMVVNLTGLAILALWIPMRLRIGIGTILNALMIGSTADVSLMLMPPIENLMARWIMLLAGVVLTGMACGIYIGAGLEPGPRDGLMTGIVRRTGWSVRATRSGIELVALAIGVLLGGKIGLGTLVYAVLIGPLVQFFLPRFAWRPVITTDPDAALALPREPEACLTSEVS